MIVLVCGGRYFKDAPLLWSELDRLHEETPKPGISLVVDGASDDVTGPYAGADFWANQWARARGVLWVRCRARWKEEGRAAGPIRNRRMLEAHKPHIVVAFPGGAGTKSMVGLAIAAGVPVREIER